MQRESPGSAWESLSKNKRKEGTQSSQVINLPHSVLKTCELDIVNSILEEKTEDRDKTQIQVL